MFLASRVNAEPEPECRRAVSAAASEDGRAHRCVTISVAPAQHYQLANGLRVVVQEDHRQPIVAVLVGYDVGVRHQRPGYSDLAHLVEHMTFRGSRHLGDYEGVTRLERAGLIDYNGATDFDHTTYHELVPASALELALWFESERMAFTLEKFNQKTFEIERDVVKNEAQLRNGYLTRFWNQSFCALLGSTHPYCPSEHRLEELETLELTHAQYFYQQGYRPDNATLVVVGDLDAARARALIERYFGSIVNPRMPKPKVRPVGRANTGISGLRFEYPAFVEELSVYFAAPPLGIQEELVAEILLPLLDDALTRTLVDREGLANSVRVKYWNWDLTALFSIDVTPAKGVSLEQLEARVNRELHSLLPQLKIAGLEASKTNAIMRRLKELESPLARAVRHFDWVRRNGSAYDLAKELSLMRGVNQSDVKAFLKLLSDDAKLVARLIRDKDADSEDVSFEMREPRVRQ